ncbi:MAG: hypothetical protein ACREQI_03735 [Candidatus Binataceae bacterium]
MAKTAVYSWRVSARTKEELENAARRTSRSVASLLESIVDEWIKAEKIANGDDELAQRQLHAAAAMAIGTLNGRNPLRAEQARRTIRKRLTRRYASQRPH